jgi:tRNA (guanine37-N1)-methyltransferase
MRIDILTIFPEIWSDYLGASILGRAQEEKLVDIRVHNIRDFAADKHKTVDDAPYGGGAGMVMKIEPIDRALHALKKIENGNKENRTVVLSARGEQFDQRKAEEYAKLDQLTLICGRYEGIDQRVADYLADEELSIGPYVLNGGEVAAMAVLEATVRLIPGVLGNPNSLREESFIPNTKYEIRNTNVEHPQYTKPADYKGWKVPEVLLSGNHAGIKKWREEHRG